MKFTYEGKTYNVAKSELEPIVKNLDVNYDEAFQVWLDDNDIVANEEAETLQEKASKIKIDHGASAEIKKERKPRERKVDDEKGHILGCVKTLLEGMGADVLNVKTETEIDFNYGLNHYTIKLTKHRPKK